VVNLMNERIETAFVDEYARLKHEGVDKLLEKRLDEMLFLAYRRGYIRGHSDRSREVRDAEDQAIREGRVEMGVDVKYEDDRLILRGKDITPERTPEGPSHDRYR
jgi:hypothetical protein